MNLFAQAFPVSEPREDGSRISLRDAFFGALLALFYLAGRWGFGRIEGADPGVRFSFGLREMVLGAGLILYARPLHALRQASTYCREFSIMLVLCSAYLAYMMIASLWGPRFEFALFKAYEAALILLVIWGIASVSKRRRGDGMTLGFWASLTVLAAMLLVVAVFNLVVQGLNSMDNERLSVLGGGPNVFGRTMGLLILVSLYCIPRSARSSPLWAIVAGLAGAFLALSGSRGSLVATILAVLALYLVDRAAFGRKWLAVVLILLIGLLLLEYTDLGEMVGSSFDLRVQRLMIDRIHTSGREDLYYVAWELGLREPLIGVGLGGFPALAGAEYPHNSFLESFCEGGLIGVVLFSLPILYLATKLVLSPRILSPLAVAAFALSFVSSQFSGDLFDTRGVQIFGLLAFAQSPMAGPPPRLPREGSAAEATGGEGTSSMTGEPGP
jgi:hypothetical protein